MSIRLTPIIEHTEKPQQDKTIILFEVLGKHRGITHSMTLCTAVAQKEGNRFPIVYLWDAHSPDN